MARKRQAEDDSDELASPNVKKTKAERAKVKTPAKGADKQAGGKGKDSDGANYWEIGNKRRINVTEFKGTLLVNIREYYEADGEFRPGKKGISLSLDQYKALLKAIPEINSDLRAQGHDIVDPEPSAAASTSAVAPAAAGNPSASPKKKEKAVAKKTKKANIEMTSDEEDGEED